MNQYCESEKSVKASACEQRDVVLTGEHTDEELSNGKGDDEEDE